MVKVYTVKDSVKYADAVVVKKNNIWFVVNWNVYPGAGIIGVLELIRTLAKLTGQTEITSITKQELQEEERADLERFEDAEEDAYIEMTI